MSTNYPGALDSYSDKTDSVDDVMAADVNNLQDAVVAIQTELGTDPAGTLTDVATRLLKSISTGGLLEFNDATTLTISSGSVTSTQNYHLVDTEGSAATDNLDTINGGAEARLLIIRTVDSTRNVVIKHNTGNIVCGGGADITLDYNYDLAILIYDATLTKWVAMGMSSGGALGADNTWTGSNYFNSGLRFKYSGVSTDTTLSDAYYAVDVDSSGGNVTITLPTAASDAGRVFVVRKNASANTVTIDPDGSETINGSATLALTAQYTSYTLMSDGTNWMVI
jgi:hypothetical protein